MEANPNRVRERRVARGLSQVALGERARLTRQSIGAIEAGRAIPAVDVALRIASALDCRVEDLFGPAPSEAAIVAEPATAATGTATAGRVALAQIGSRWVSLPLAAEGFRLSADGIAAATRSKQTLVEPLRSLEDVKQNVVLMGCAGALGLLADRLNARGGPGRFLWLPAASTAALAALRRGTTHVAGVHLVDPRSGQANVPDVRRAATSETLVLVTLARWEAGLVCRAADARRIRTVADLGRRGLRLIARESGAGAQRLLERELEAAGLSTEIARRAALVAPGHAELARAIAMGAADAGVATRDAALAFGLHFVPLAEERYDLVVPKPLLDDPRIERLLQVLVSSSTRRELAAIGYDVAPTGERVAEVSAA